eukprot:GFKZ01002048.1.p1 GENE.GFKZ01002048.1~~GFKZ01002048.1.p1  ORF type:complete len:441 (-),score=47.93 GFKZ01002048.1:401-1606(-)
MRLCPAFLPSLPLDFTHSHSRSSTLLSSTATRHAPRLRPSMTTNQTSPVTKPPDPTPPPLPLHISSSPFFTSLYLTFTSRTPYPHLPPHLSPSVTWDTPLFTFTKSADLLSTLSSFFSTFIDPTLTIHPPNSSSPASLSFLWTLSFTWPLPWRPRVALSASTTLLFENHTLTSIKDEWFCPPQNLIRQALPTFTDVVWLWPTPHPENDLGMRQILAETPNYTLMRLAPRLEFRVQGAVLDYERERIWSAPCVPPDAFAGGLRRKEMYSVSTPISVRQVDDNLFEWAFNVPGTLVGSSEVQVAEPIGGAELLYVEERVVAVRRFWGDAVGERVKKEVDEIITALKTDGKVSGVWWGRSFDSRVGFNRKGQFAMATFGNSAGVPRRNEVMVEIEVESAGADNG